MPSAGRGERADDAERDADPLDRLRPEAGEHVQREPRQAQRRVARRIPRAARARRRPRRRDAPPERTSAFVNFCLPIEPSIGSTARAPVRVERAAEVGDRDAGEAAQHPVDHARRAASAPTSRGARRAGRSRRRRRASTAATSFGMSSGWFCRSPSIVTRMSPRARVKPGVHRRVLAEVAREADGAHARVALVQALAAASNVPSVEPSSTKRSSNGRAVRPPRRSARRARRPSPPR